MILADMRKERSPAFRARAGLRTVAYLNGHATMLVLALSMYSGRIGAADRPTKNRFQGWRCYKTTLAAIKARSSSALIFRGE